MSKNIISAAAIGLPNFNWAIGEDAVHSDTALFLRIARVILRLRARMDTINDEIDRIKSANCSGAPNMSAWEEAFARSEALRQSYTRMRDFYLRIAVRIATRVSSVSVSLARPTTPC